MEITVIIPVYPILRLLPRALESLQRQTFKDFDVVVVVDNEGDFEEEERSIIDRFPSMKIKFINHGKNRGTLQARLTGIDHITGKYVFFMDHDDEVEDCVLYNTYHQAEKENADIVGMKLSTFIPRKYVLEGDHIHFHNIWKVSQNEAPMVSYLYRSDLVKRTKEMLNIPDDLYLIYLEDMYLSACIMSQAKKVIENYENGIYQYNHDNPLSTLTFNDGDPVKKKQQLEQKKTVINLINKFFVENKCDKISINYKTNNLGNYILHHKNKIIR